MDVKTAYEQWLHDFAADADTIADLKAIANDPAEIEDRFYTELSFGTAGMRGVLGAGMNRMNRYNVRRATKGLAKYLLQNPQEAQRGVVIAYDSRRFSAEFARDTALVLAHEGVPAYLFDALRPVPILSYAVRHLHAIAGIVITASHNPPQYNGYKVYAEDGAQVGPEAADGITAFIRSTPYTDCKLMDEEEAKAKGLLKIIGNKEVDDDYIAQVKTLCIQPELLAEEGSKLSIVYTPIHGSGNVPVRRILREVGISNVSVVKEQELPDPNFSTVKVPNPEDPGAFVLAIKLADEVGAKVIFATDPDCDRLGVAVKTGNGDWQLLTGNQIGCVLLHYILSTKQKQGTLPKNGAAVKSIVSTSLANKIAASFGVEMFETLTGFKFIGEQIGLLEAAGEADRYIFGFEESYGYLSGAHVRDKDAVNATLLVCEAAAWYAKQGMTLLDAINKLYAEFGCYRNALHSFAFEGESGMHTMDAIMKQLRQTPPTAIGGMAVESMVDYNTAGTGLPKANVLEFRLAGGAKLMVRPSGTEPKIKVYLSAVAPTEEAADAINDTLGKAAAALLKA